MPAIKTQESDANVVFESIGQPSKVDAEAGVIQGVKLLGRVSVNGGTYTKECIQDAYERRVYEGARVNLDHPDRTNPSADRRVADRFGKVVNVQLRDGELFGDVHYLKSHPLSAVVCEAAERMPDTLGMSHNARTRQRVDGGKLFHERIERVRSVDLVADPATTRGIFESEDMSKSTPTKKLKELTGALPKSVFRTALEAEIAADPAMGEMPVEVAPEADSDAQVKAAFRAMVIAAFDDDSLDAKATLARIKEILAAQEKLTGKSDSDTEEDKSGGDAAESHKSLYDALDVLESAGVPATKIRVKALQALESAEERKALAETWKGIPGGEGGGAKPRSTPKGGNALESDAGGKPDAAKIEKYKDPKAAAAMLRG